jgi:hypothetical protein
MPVVPLALTLLFVWAVFHAPLIFGLAGLSRIA